jgi:hypothetical protein
MQVIAALESWARPIKEAALRAAEAEPGSAGNRQVRLQLRRLTVTKFNSLVTCVFHMYVLQFECS